MKCRAVDWTPHWGVLVVAVTCCYADDRERHRGEIGTFQINTEKLRTEALWFSYCAKMTENPTQTYSDIKKWVYMLLVLHKLQYFPLITGRKDLFSLWRDGFHPRIRYFQIVGTSVIISTTIKVKRTHTGTADCLFEAVKIDFCLLLLPDSDIVLVRLLLRRNTRTTSVTCLRSCEGRLRFPRICLRLK